MVASGIDEKTLKREGVCAASLPTTMAVVAGLLVQNALKYFLGFGTVSHYVGYNALSDFFPQMSMRPNPQCSSSYCCQRQREYQAHLATLPPPEADKPTDQSDEVVHESNEWGISLVGETCPGDLRSEDHSLRVAEGLQLAYSQPEPEQATPTDTQEQVLEGTEDMNIEDLMQQLKKL